jgi:serine protease Do
MSLNEGVRLLEPCIIGIQTVEGESLGRGTGFFITDDGYAVTCSHVVKFDRKMSRGAIYQNTAKEWKDCNFEIIADNPDVDIAIIKLETTEKVKAAKLCPSLKGKSVAGSEVGVIGFHKAFDIGWAFIVHGIISAAIKGEPVKEILSGVQYLFQIDAICHGGCSGGPVFLSETNEVIGVLSRGKPEAGGISTNISFVIPIDKTTIDYIFQQVKEAKELAGSKD